MKNLAVLSKGLSLKNKDYNIASGNHVSPSGPFRVMIGKEIADHIRSWRFIVLLLLIGLTFFGAMHISLSNIKTAVSNIQDPDRLFLYLKLLTTTDGTLPPFHVLLSFLGPLLGISLGFDTINSEQNAGTLTRLMAQPVYRDNLILSKFVSAMIIVSCLFVSLALLMIGAGLLITGVDIAPQEVLRIFSFIFLSIVYVGFWLSLSILLSIRFKQTATSALTAIGLWLFLTVFYKLLVNLVIKAMIPDPAFLSQEQVFAYNGLMGSILRLEPSQLYTDATTTLLMPSVRSLGPLTVEQMALAIPSPLPFKESLMIIWPQLSGLLAATVFCFALSYYLFMRREIRC
ncbi:ABC transporter permease [Dyadobacter luteus]|jgi:ABC-2 type transport system permease protein|uniref:ABC transporter permease n=1 Tax=Dyadobacter luteus TaxID=2259619 RepID=A0A3D8Y336_9BACT|nr:ABC transporter permease subunit [Dyadobacter luteus]REA56427.1 ABC transporter permease [Dyadobacter luteus]